MNYNSKYGAVIGVDIGNYSTKTAKTLTPNGYEAYNTEPALVEDVLIYNGVYYAPTSRRFPFVLDKRKNDQCLIMALFGVCKEIICELEEQKIPKAMWQKKVSLINNVNIGLGLPPEHIQSLGKGTHEYFDEKMGKGIEVTYKGINFKFKMNRCAVYPQGIVTVLGNKECAIANDYETYIIIDIGGFTADIIQIDEDEPVYSECLSLEYGVNVMFSNIAKKIKKEMGVHIDNLMVESVLLNKKSILEENVVSEIRKGAEKHVTTLLNQCREIGIDFRVKPCVFVGGGSLLLRSFIESNSMLSVYEFISDVFSNAKFFELYLYETLQEENEQGVK